MNLSAFSFKTITTLAVLGLIGSSIHAQTPLVGWAFDNGKGAPTLGKGIVGGVLRIDGSDAGSALFKIAGGAGAATPGVLDATANPYGTEYGSARICSGDSPLIANTDLSQFVVTMWIKPSVPPVRQPYARLLNISRPGDVKTDPGLCVALHNSDIEVILNGKAAVVTLPSGTIKEGVWTFVVFVYDGMAKNPYYSAAMNEVVGGEHNGAVLTGSLSDAVKLAGTVGINTGAPTYNISPGELVIDGLTVAVGSSNSTRARAFSGLMDDIRIYKGLLTIGQIDAVRASVKGK